MFFGVMFVVSLRDVIFTELDSTPNCNVCSRERKIYLDDDDNDSTAVTDDELTCSDISCRMNFLLS